MQILDARLECAFALDGITPLITGTVIGAYACEGGQPIL
jgi:hypothetical protein